MSSRLQREQGCFLSHLTLRLVQSVSRLECQAIFLESVALRRRVPWQARERRCDVLTPLEFTAAAPKRCSDGG